MGSGHYDILESVDDAVYSNNASTASLAVGSNDSVGGNFSTIIPGSSVARLPRGNSDHSAGSGSGVYSEHADHNTYVMNCYPVIGGDSYGLQLPSQSYYPLDLSNTNILIAPPSTAQPPNTFVPLPSISGNVQSPGPFPFPYHLPHTVSKPTHPPRQRIENTVPPHQRGELSIRNSERMFDLEKNFSALPRSIVSKSIDQ